MKQFMNGFWFGIGLCTAVSAYFGVAWLLASGMLAWME